MILGNGTFAGSCRHDRRAKFFGNRQRCLAAIKRAAAENDDRALGRIELWPRCCDLVGLWQGAARQRPCRASRRLRAIFSMSSGISR